jgi:hypothetical protein
VKTLDPAAREADDGIFTGTFGDKGARQAQPEGVRLQRGAVGNPRANASADLYPMPFFLNISYSGNS